MHSAQACMHACTPCTCPKTTRQGISPTEALPHLRRARRGEQRAERVPELRDERAARARHLRAHAALQRPRAVVEELHVVAQERWGVEEDARLAISRLTLGHVLDQASIDRLAIWLRRVSVLLYDGLMDEYLQHVTREVRFRRAASLGSLSALVAAYWQAVLLAYIHESVSHISHYR